MGHYLFTSESVAQGHPDKIADQISDAILDACLAEDPYSKVACETLVTAGTVFLAGEITSQAKIHYQDIVRKTIKEIGYDDPAIGFDYRTCGILISINKQSEDIARGVELEKEIGAGDQGMMFGYASDETDVLMPLPIHLAHQIVEALRQARITKQLPYLRPDAKAQVTVEYSENHVPIRIHTIVISTQHIEEVSLDQITKDMLSLASKLAPKEMIDKDTLFYINPTGRFVIGGPQGDTGMTGRKIIVDTYGGMARHGGGAFSGKDPSKVDRSATYAARHVAKNIVAAGLAKRCEVQVSYAIGIAHPISIRVDTFGTGQLDEAELSRIIPLVFDLSPKGIIDKLQLRRPIYKKTAYGGHFGRNDPDFTWEKLDATQKLIETVKYQ